MNHFTNSAYESMMTRKPEGGKEISCPPSLSPSHFCYGCEKYGQACVSPCYREMNAWLKKRKVRK